MPAVPSSAGSPEVEYFRVRTISNVTLHNAALLRIQADNPGQRVISDIAAGSLQLDNQLHNELWCTDQCITADQLHQPQPLPIIRTIGTTVAPIISSAY